MSAGRSLRYSAILTVVGALCATAMIAALITAGTYFTAFDRSAQGKGAAVAADFGEKLQRIESDWETHLMREKTRLEFSRLLEDPAGRWDRLRAYLAALSDSPMYAGLTLCGADGQPLFRQGPAGTCRTGPEMSARGHSHHYVSDAKGHLYIELDAPIWLGPDGMGVMHMAIPLDHAFLRHNAYPGTELFIAWKGRILASSAGESGLLRAQPGYSGRLERDGRRYEQRTVAFPESDTSPQLLVQTLIEPPFSLAESVTMGLAIFVLIAVLMALALRNWLSRLLPRIESLGRVARLYGAEEAISPTLNRELARAAVDADELGSVALAMRDMVAALATREQARREEEVRRKRDEERLRLAEKVFANSTQAILVTDAAAHIVSVNPAFTAITGYSVEEAIGENPRKFSSGRHDGAFYAAMWAALRRDGTWNGEVWDRRKNGAVYPKWLTINAVHDADSGEVSHYVGIFSDISERKENEARIEHLAYHDPLTGLPNRFALNAHLAQSLADARRNATELAVMFIDLDRFKTINDSLGHNIGDQLLVAVAGRIRHALREIDTVARLGGDEFVIVVPGIGGPDDAARVADKIIAEVGEPLVLEGHSLHTSPSIGIAIYPSDGGDSDTLMKNADTAMYYAKEHGRNAYHFFSATMNTSTGARLLLETRMHSALDRGEFFLVYQPQVEIATGVPVGVEALLRWQHPDRGVLLPEEFIPVAEESGLIVPLGAWVLEEACREAMRWQDGASSLRVAVNLSPLQLKDRHLAQHVAATLAQTGLPAERLELEITESAVMSHTEEAVDTLRSLIALGVCLAIDDFGTGYSSLDYLMRLPHARLKIDRSFVASLDAEDEKGKGMPITAGIVALARSLGLPVTAEGIETPAQLECLKNAGCGEGQGFLFSRPLSAEALRDWLAPASLPMSGDAAENDARRLH